jgi:hypothetical protein
MGMGQKTRDQREAGMRTSQSGRVGDRSFLKTNVVGAALAVLLFGATPSYAIDAAVSDVYVQLSISPPTTGSVVVCHGFGCRFRTAVGLGPKDHGKLKQLFAAGKKSTPETERKAVAAATKWFDVRVGPEAGTTRRVAYAGVRSEQGPEQMDCIDISRNNTSLLLVLDQMGLLKHHKVDPPRARGLLFDRWPHATAVLRETVSGKQWAIDNWTHKFGEGPDVMPLDEWLKSGF